MMKLPHVARGYARAADCEVLQMGWHLGEHHAGSLVVLSGSYHNCIHHLQVFDLAFMCPWPMPTGRPCRPHAAGHNTRHSTARQW